MATQLPLGVALRDDATLASYFIGKNLQAWVKVKAAAQGRGPTFLYLWGSTGVGKTHLLQGACMHSNQHDLPALYLPLSELKTGQPHCLNGLEHLSLVCIDDIGCIAGRADWEESLFHLYNRLRANPEAHLIVAGHATPQQSGLHLADLTSRLSWGESFHIQPLDDEDLIDALQVRAEARGLHLSDDVALYLIRRSPRSMTVLTEQLDRLDKASLAAQRRLTIPFVRTVLNIA